MEQAKAGLPLQAGPKDVFLHLLSIIFLYVAVGSFISLVFSYLNVRIPDPLQKDYYYISSIYGSIRWAISILIIVFPSYLWSVWFLNRAYAVSPEKREIKSRRWLIYLTLTIAALVIIGDLVALVYNFLQGEFTIRFLLKVFTILLVAGSVFVYYLWEVRRVILDPKPWYISAVSYGAMVLVIAAIVAGFLVVGSPQEERAYRFDDQRISDLQMIQGNILSFWQAKERMPENLSELKDEFSGFTPPKDPETDVDYGYKKTGELSFELCAQFNRPSRELGATSARPALEFSPYYPESDNWEHKTGQVCFSRTIDPERYPPLEKPKR